MAESIVRNMGGGVEMAEHPDGTYELFHTDFNVELNKFIEESKTFDHLPSNKEIDDFYNQVDL
jgi:hypothetical protein